YIKAGDIIAYVYSPDLIEAQNELFEAFTMKEAQPELFEATRKKLENWKFPWVLPHAFASTCQRGTRGVGLLFLVLVRAKYNQNPPSNRSETACLCPLCVHYAFSMLKNIAYYCES
ncbi:MAG: efflux RND transporter periplasmic adaptor subunit, partial [Rhodospirillales bacterium]